jgi:DNA-binding CsgD family transcriptional regulator
LPQTVGVTGGDGFKIAPGGARVPLQQIYLDISQSPDEATFRRRLIAFAHHMDFPLVSAVLMGDRPDATQEYCPYVGNRPADFVGESFDTKNQAVDPVLARLRQERSSFAYDQKFYVDGAAPQLWEVAAPWGFRTGVCVSLQLSPSRLFLFGLDRERPLPKDQSRLQRLLADLHRAAEYSQDVADRLLGQHLGGTQARLSPREREILLWVLEGKSNWAIAQLLCVSENTVKFHLKAVFVKLRVNSRILAATRANAFGLLKGLGC